MIRKRRSEENRKNTSSRKVWVRKRVKTPFPTNYLPTIPLKLSAVLRYHEFKSLIKKTERTQRKERDMEISKYSVLVSELEKNIEEERELLIKNKGEGSRILLFKIHPKFDGVLGKCIRYLSFQDSVKVVSVNSNYSKIGEEPSRLIYVKIKI